MALGERRPRTIVGATTALTLSILLGGCTDGSAGTPTPTVSALEAPSVEPSSAAPEPTSAAPSAEVEKPVPPEAMRRDDVAGAEAAAQYFLELYPYVYATGDLTEWDAMSDPQCKFCAGVRTKSRELQDLGGRQEGGRMSIIAIDSRPPETSEHFAVWIDAEEEATRRLDSSGNVIEEFPGGTIEFDIAIAWTGSDWIVRGVDARTVGG
ncbi:DUF6318 family protein [Georgenia muralis]